MTDAKNPARYPAKDSNEGQTGVTYYTVQPGHSLRARGRSYREGEQVPLGTADAARLVDSGAVASLKAKARTDSPMATCLDGNAPDVIGGLSEQGLDADGLAELAELETAGKNRKTVLEAIEAARAALSEGQE